MQIEHAVVEQALVSNNMSNQDKIIKEITNSEYKYGFVTDIEQELIEPGLSEDVVRLISSKKSEPEWLLEWRLKAYNIWRKMEEPEWADLDYKKADYENIIYYAAPKKKKQLKSLDEVDPDLLDTYNKLRL